MLRWKDKLTTSAACYLALEVTDNMVFFKTTVKLYQLFLSAVQLVCKNKRIFDRIRRIALVRSALVDTILQGTRSIKIRTLSSPSVAFMVPPRVVISCQI